jgi:hypothetical protein
MSPFNNIIFGFFQQFFVISWWSTYCQQWRNTDKQLNTFVLTSIISHLQLNYRMKPVTKTYNFPSVYSQIKVSKYKIMHSLLNSFFNWSFKFFVLFTLLISLYFTIWNLCKYFCKYPRMQQYVIFNVLKEYCIPKEEETYVSTMLYSP